MPIAAAALRPLPKNEPAATRQQSSRSHRAPMNIAVLGPARYPSPRRRWVDDSERIPATIVHTVDARPADDLLFELAGARRNLFFNPPETRAGIVTCGGLCPGLNDVIRSLFFEMHHGYGAKEVL